MPRRNIFEKSIGFQRGLTKCLWDFRAFAYLLGFIFFHSNPLPSGITYYHKSKRTVKKNQSSKQYTQFWRLCWQTTHSKVICPLMCYNEENPHTPIQYLRDANCVGTSKSEQEQNLFTGTDCTPLMWFSSTICLKLHFFSFLKMLKVPRTGSK